VLLIKSRGGLHAHHLSKPCFKARDDGRRRFCWQEDSPRLQANVTLRAASSWRTLCSSSRFTAGAARFFILSQSGERPERYIESLRFDTMPSSPILQAWAKTVGPSPSICC